MLCEYAFIFKKDSLVLNGFYENYMPQHCGGMEKKMGKKINYKIGDIFIVPLEENLKGAGRILKINQATVFIELYHMKPVKEISDFNFEEATKNIPLVMAWCYDDGLVKGGWKVFDNKPVDTDIEMPYFWHSDAGDGKYYIRKGTEDSFRTFGERIEIKKEDINKYDSGGIGNEISKTNMYTIRLKEAGLL